MQAETVVDEQAVATQAQAQGQPSADDQVAAGDEAQGNEAGGAQEESVESLREQLAEAKTRTEKLEADNRSFTRGRAAQEERDNALVERIRAETEGTRRAIQALGKAISPEDRTGLQAELDDIARQSATTEADSAFNRRYTRMWTSLEDAANGADGNPVIDLKGSVEYADFRDRWTAAKGAQDLGEMAVMVGEAARLARDAERAKAPAPGAKKEEPGPKRNLDMDISGGGSAGVTEQELVNRFGRGEQMSPAEMAKANEAMDKGVLPKVS